MFEFELAKAQYTDPNSIFNQMLNRFNKIDDLVTGLQVQQLRDSIDKKLKLELARVKEVRADSKNYVNNQEWTKIP